MGIFEQPCAKPVVQGLCAYASRLRRLVQSVAVDACSNHGWVIPFKQMTVHLDQTKA
jgi:hypothetical protein